MRSRAPLVGRAPELQALEAALAAAGEQAGQVVLVAGEAGAGKTRLVTELLAAHPEVPALVGGCVELSQAAVPFLPLAGALRRLANERGDEAAAALLDGSAAPLLALVPRLSTGDPSGAAQDPLRLFEALPVLLDRIAPTGPAVLVIEDLHWADASTLDLVRFLALTAMPGRLVLVTFRSDEMRRRHPLRPLLAELARLPVVTRVDVQPLGAEQVTELVGSLVGGAASSLPLDRIVDRAEGNPFFVEELVAAYAGQGTAAPSPLDDVLDARLDRLPDTAWAAVEVVAAIGRRASHALVQQVADLDPAALSGGLRAAVEDGALVVDPIGYTFRHALLQEAAYARLLAGDRIALHQRIAHALVADPGLAEGGAQAAAGEIAFHAEQAGDLETAYAASIRAAERASETYAITEAHVHYERAVSLASQVSGDAGEPSLGELRIAAGLAASRVGDNVAARAHYERALEAVPRSDLATVLVATRLLAEMLWIVGEPGRGDELVQAALDDIGSEPGVARAELLAQQGMKAVVRGAYELAEGCGREALALARAHGSRWGEIRALEATGCALVFQGADVEEGLAMAREALALALADGDLDAYVHAGANLSTALDSAGQLAECDRVTEETVRLCEERGFAGAILDFQRLNLCWTLVRRGDWDEAAAMLRRLRFSRHEGMIRNFRWVNAAILAARRGQYDEARLCLDALVSSGGAVGPQWEGPQAWIQLLIGLGTGDEQLLKLGTAALVGAPVDPATIVHYPTAARALADRALADPGVAEEALATCAELADRLAAPPGLSEPMRQERERLRRTIEAESARATGTDSSACWQAVLDVPSEGPDAADCLYVAWRLADATYAEGGDPSAILVPAWERATAIGSVLAADLERSARRARVRLPGMARDETAGVVDHGLTAREREVLALVARGATNQAIADQLFISAKTASVHVSNILAKLGATNRAEAGAIARDLGI
ncbi:ATP-binding protein [Nocardioides ultimimeridianus]